MLLSEGLGLGIPSLILLGSRECVIVASKRPLERCGLGDEYGFLGSLGEQLVILCVDLTSGL